jgi:3-hydroxyisobutyrate dehydrogenase
LVSWLLIGAAVLGGLGFAAGRAPGHICSQVVMRISLGTQFRHEFLTKLFAVMRSAVLPCCSVLTGKVLGLEAPVIAGFQMVRILVIMLLCVPCYRLFECTTVRVATRLKLNWHYDRPRADHDFRSSRRPEMIDKSQKIGWIGAGRMGFPMAERLLKAGYQVSIWNRTRTKAEPLVSVGGKIVDKLADLAEVDVLFSIVSTGKDLEEVYFGKDGVVSRANGTLPRAVVDCSTIAVEESADIRKRLRDHGADFIAAPVSGNAKVIKAGRLSAVVSGPEATCKGVMPIIEVFAPQGVSYVGDGELARVCKIAHNVMLGVVIENLIEITLLANKMGVPRHAFLAFINNSVMGSMFTRYKSPALVNLDWTTTFTPELLRKDMDLGLELAREHDVPMPVTAATREVLQSHFGAATLQKNPKEYLEKDFAALMETMALAAGMRLTSEDKNVPTGLES